MALDDYQVYPEVDNLISEIRQFDLFEHIVELEAYGITVVPPEKMQSSAGFIERLRTAIINACESRNDIEIDDYRTATPPREATFSNSWDLLEEDEVFVEAAINPVVLALVRWLLRSCARTSSGHTRISRSRSRWSTRSTRSTSSRGSRRSTRPTFGAYRRCSTTERRCRARRRPVLRRAHRAGLTTRAAGRRPRSGTVHRGRTGARPRHGH